MLVELLIRDFAIIDELHLELGEGLNVFTGETGAGKSIILDAVGLLLGERGSQEMIRAGASSAYVEGVFRLSELVRARLGSLLEEEGVEGEDPGILVMAREIRSEGRNICRVNGRVVTLGLLRTLGEVLVDIHGQSEHLSLLRTREQLAFLDRYAGVDGLREEVRQAVRRLREVTQELEALRQGERELAQRIDLLNYQINEIRSARIEVGEDEALRLERERLANAERLAEYGEEAYRALMEGDGEQMSAVDLLGEVVRACSALARIDETAAGLSEAAVELEERMQDLAAALRDYVDAIEYDPERLNEVEDRLALLHELMRKYGNTLEDVLAYAERAEKELDTLSHSEERIEELEAEQERLLRMVGRLGSELSARRREAGERLAQAVERELEALRMAGTRFAVSVEWEEDPEGAIVEEPPAGSGLVPGRYAFGPTGLDRVTFLVAPNVGEPLKPMAQVASGGETSRLMLAMKTALSRVDQTPTLIFDEIDQGIGGRVGGEVGRKLWGLTVHGHQVLCVTHLPQLAGYGDRHFRVEKRVVEGRTVTRVERLEGEARVSELAQMLGGDSETNRQGAREILAYAEAVKRGEQTG